MERTIYIDNKPIKMRVTARIHAEYREAFGKDLLIEIDKFNKATEEGNASLEFLENLAWLMAKKAGNQVHPPEKTATEAVGDWLDTFESAIAISKATNAILNLYSSSEKGHSKPQKK